MTENTPQTWLDRMIAEEPAARAEWPVGATYAPHDGTESDANLHYADLLSGPDENHPDPMAGWTPPVTPAEESQ